MGQQGHQLGHVHRAAAAETDHQLRLQLTGLGHGGQYHGLRRVGQHLVEHLHAHAGAGEARQQGLEQAQAGDAGVGDDQHAPGAALATEFGQTQTGAGFAKDLCGGGEAEGMHGVLLLL